MRNNEVKQLEDKLDSSALFENGKSQACELNTSSHEKVTLTVDELAAVLGVSRPTAYDLVKQKDFPSFQIGRRILIDKVGLVEWVSKQASKKR